MIVGFSQQIPYKWNNVLTCSIGAILLLATCSLIGIILLISFGVTQHQQRQFHQQQYQQQQQQQQTQQQFYRKGSTNSSRENNNYYGTPCSTTPPSTLNYSTSSTTASLSFLGAFNSPQHSGLKSAIAFSWILPTLYCIILFLIRHVMRTHAATWWLKFATVECNLLIVNQMMLAIIFYLVYGVLVKRIVALQPKALDQKFTATVAGAQSTSSTMTATTTTLATRRYVNCQLVKR